MTFEHFQATETSWAHFVEAKMGKRLYKTKEEILKRNVFFKNQVKPEPLWRNDGSFWSSNTLLRFLAVRAVSIIGFIFNISTSVFERTEDLVILIIVRNRNSAYILNTWIKNCSVTLSIDLIRLNYGQPGLDFYVDGKPDRWTKSVHGGSGHLDHFQRLSTFLNEFLSDKV